MYEVPDTKFQQFAEAGIHDEWLLGVTLWSDDLDEITIRIRSLRAAVGGIASQIGETAPGEVDVSTLSQDGLRTAYWAKGVLLPPNPDPDRDGCGVIWVVPIIPMRGPQIAAALAGVGAIMHSYGFPAGGFAAARRRQDDEGGDSAALRPQRAGRRRTCVGLRGDDADVPAGSGAGAVPALDRRHGSCAGGTPAARNCCKPSKPGPIRRVSSHPDATSDNARSDNARSDNAMSSQTAPTEFVNPLAFDVHVSPFVIFDFGAFTPDPRIVAQADRLEAKLRLAVADLPADMAKEAGGELTMYAGHRPRFVDLFYVPIWSFLHWVPEGRPGMDAAHIKDVLEKAQEAHALSLFLHLWDDHLSDAQLPPNMMRLHLRAVAWERYHAACRTLAAMVPGGDEIVTRLVHGYLTACHQPPPATDQKSFCDRFVRQIGIWLVVPTLLGHLVGGPNLARDLCAAIEAFAVAWRMIDDVQDIDKDIVSGQQKRGVVRA